MRYNKGRAQAFATYIQDDWQVRPRAHACRSACGGSRSSRSMKSTSRSRSSVPARSRRSSRTRRWACCMRGIRAFREAAIRPNGETSRHDMAAAWQAQRENEPSNGLRHLPRYGAVLPLSEDAGVHASVFDQPDDERRAVQRPVPERAEPVSVSAASILGGVSPLISTSCRCASPRTRTTFRVDSVSSGTSTSSGIWARDLVVSAAYVGTKAEDLPTSRQINPAVYGPGATLANRQQRRLYPQFEAIMSFDPIGGSEYHGMQLSVNKRFSRGYSILANYTLSKARDNASNDDGFSARRIRSIRWTRGAWETATSGIALVTSVLWELPSPQAPSGESRARRLAAQRHHDAFRGHAVHHQHAAATRC